MDDTLHKLAQRLDAGELTAAIAADAHAALDRAEVLVLAGNAAEARRVVASFLHDVEFKPAVGVRENGNVSLLSHPALAQQVANAVASYAGRPDLEHEESVRRHSERIFKAALQEQLDQAEREAALARRKKKQDDDEAALLLALVASPLFMQHLPNQLRKAASAAYHWSAQALALPPDSRFPAPAQPPSALEQLKAAKGHGDSREPLYRKAAEGIRQRLAQSISRGVAGGESSAALARRFDEALAQEAEIEGKLVSETEAQVIYGVTQSSALRAAGFSHKRWVSVGDDRVRHSHVECDAQGAIPAESPFANGLMHPGDPNGPASEVVNCRCHLEGARGE